MPKETNQPEQETAVTDDRIVHTPGPWTVETEVMGQDTTAIVVGYEIKDAGSPIVIAWTSGRDEHGFCPKTTKEDTANARLISAAPELLEAGELILKQLQDSGWPPSSAQLKLGQAICKAKGLLEIQDPPSCTSGDGSAEAS